MIHRSFNRKPIKIELKSDKLTRLERPGEAGFTRARSIYVKSTCIATRFPKNNCCKNGILNTIVVTIYYVYNVKFGDRGQHTVLRTDRYIIQKAAVDRAANSNAPWSCIFCFFQTLAGIVTRRQVGKQKKKKTRKNARFRRENREKTPKFAVRTLDGGRARLCRIETRRTTAAIVFS